MRSSGIKSIVNDNCTHDCDGVVEERLAEDDDVEDLVDVDLLKDGENGDLRQFASQSNGELGNFRDTGWSVTS